MSGSTSAHACIYHRANMQAGKHAPRAKQKACRELGDVVSSQPHGLKRREVRWSIAHSTSINMDSYDEVLEVLGQRTDNQVLCGLRTGSRTAANLIEHKMLCTLFCNFFRTNFPECAFTTVLALKVSIRKATLVTNYSALKSSLGPCLVTCVGRLAPPLCIYGRGPLDVQAPAACVVTDTRIPFGIPAARDNSEVCWELSCGGKGNWQMFFEVEHTPATMCPRLPMKDP